MELTFGFELEGFTDRKLQKDLETKYKGACDYKTDGSVNQSRIVDMYEALIGTHDKREKRLAVYSREEDGDYDNPFSRIQYATEFGSPVFDSMEELTEVMDMFKPGKTHFWDYSCGLHLNISTKDQYQHGRLMALACDLEFIKHMQKLAMTEMCEHQKERLKNPSCLDYCGLYRGSKGLLWDYKCGEKYRFLRFHPGGRLEFRFLSPCEHKAENSKIVVNELIKHLDSVKKTTHKIMADTAAERRSYTITPTIGKSPKQTEWSWYYDQQYNSNHIVKWERS